MSSLRQSPSCAGVPGAGVPGARVLVLLSLVLVSLVLVSLCWCPCAGVLVLVCLVLVVVAASFSVTANHLAIGAHAWRLVTHHLQKAAEKR